MGNFIIGMPVGHREIFGFILWNMKKAISDHIMNTEVEEIWKSRWETGIYVTNITCTVRWELRYNSHLTVNSNMVKFDFIFL